MITCYLKGGLAESRTFLENLHLFKCAESLGKPCRYMRLSDDDELCGFRGCGMSC